MQLPVCPEARQLRLRGHRGQPPCVPFFRSGLQGHWLPIAKVATKIAIGYTLDEITNDVTGKTCACFEPALDYIVVKYPKWPFDKFVYADKSLGTQMMATGEVMSIWQQL